MRKAIYALLVAGLMIFSYVEGRQRTSRPAEAAPEARRVLYYVDPMHPAYKSDKPGTAPDCGMKLEPVYADAGGTGPSSQDGLIHISSEKQQLIGVRVVPVEVSSGTRELRLTGRVAVDETRMYRVNSGAEGWIEQTFGDSVGTQVKKGQRLASFYSRELWTAEQSYLSGTYGTTPSREAGQSNPASVDRLRNLGVSDEQIKELSKQRQASTEAYVASPSDGFIMTRNISTGEKFDRGMEFYRIADLSHVWILADVFEDDTQTYRPGMMATVTLPQGKKLRARVSDVLPQIDPTTRTFKLRLEADNPGFVLRPEMFVDVHLSVRLPAGLSVSADALVDSGLTKRVYVESEPGVFEARNVETGWRLGDRIQVLRGLHAGERVVSAGTFLLDSESKLASSEMSHSDAPASAIPSDTKPEPMREVAPSVKQISAPGDTTLDPKCGMQIGRSKAAAAGNSLAYGGKAYYFCSRACKDEFEKNPEKYIATERAMAGAGR
jgi:multidrug efflux pump subunit AcrA (membrane-fusion protein)/YHS domain-containing protein